MEDGREKKEASHSFPTADLNSCGNNGSQANTSRGALSSLLQKVTMPDSS